MYMYIIYICVYIGTCTPEMHNDGGGGGLRMGFIYGLADVRCVHVHVHVCNFLMYVYNV